MLNLLSADLLGQWGKSEYVSLGEEYLRTQEIAAVAVLHEREGLLVPSVRAPDANLVILTQANVDACCGEPIDLGLIEI